MNSVTKILPTALEVMKNIMDKCLLCPRNCKADRKNHHGMCGMSNTLKLAKASLHMWEEPCISGKNGSGTIFFSGCSLKCCFCQNYSISHETFGKEISVNRLGDIFLELQQKGAENINLVSGSHFVPQIISALDMVKHKLSIPIVYNSSGYESISTLKLLEGYIDIYLPDFKYYSNELSKKYSNTENYFEHTSKAIVEMHRQQPKLIFNGEMLKKGVIIRHMILPHCRKDSIQIIDWIYKNLPQNSYFVSLMSQYTPCYKSKNFSEINRRITTFEYKSVLQKILDYNINGFFQDRQSATLEYTPDFDLEGI